MVGTIIKKIGGKAARTEFGIVRYKSGQSNLMIPSTHADPGGHIDYIVRDDGDIELHIHPDGLFSIFRGNGQTGTLRATLPSLLSQYAPTSVIDLESHDLGDGRWLVPISQFQK